ERPVAVIGLPNPRQSRVYHRYADPDVATGLPCISRVGLPCGAPGALRSALYPGGTMNDGLTDRLNQILPTITSEAFLRGKGLGNEIAFYIFDYPPEAELRVREHLQFLLDHLPKHKPGIRVKHVHLLDFVLTYLRQRHLLDKAIVMQQTKGDAFVLKQVAT